MSERLRRVAADVEEARKNLLPSGASQPQLLELELDEEALSFQVEGLGEFTAFVPDPYPGETTVYGPDDWELEHCGPLEDVLQAALARLRHRALPLPRLLTTSDRTVTECSAGADDLLAAAPMEPLLQEHLRLGRCFLGADAVEHVEMAEVWRVRVRVGLRSLAGEDIGGELVSATTADAWGLDPQLPVVMELHLPKTGYMSAASPSDLVKAIWQEHYPKFLLEKQLLKILNDFYLHAIGRPLTGIPGETSYSEDEQETINEYLDRKVAMMSEALRDPDLGFLVHMAIYCQLRIARMHEYCALCDQPFALPPMLLRTVCSRELCTHQFCEFGKKITSAEGLNTQGEIVELLVFMLTTASASHRKELVLDPYPCVYTGSGELAVEVFHPKNKDYKKLATVIAELRTLRSENAPTKGAAWTSMFASMSPEGVGLVQWVMASNRTYLAPLRAAQRIQALCTPYQYLLISAPPEKEAAFQKLKELHGTIFAFHGSHVGNWHSILRNGLKNASGTALMSAGAAYGNGIYLGKSSAISMGYSGFAGHGGAAAPQSPPPALQRQITGNRFLEKTERISLLALCEVVQHPSLRSYDWGYVAPEEDTVCTRFLLVTDGMCGNIELTPDVVQEIRSCMAKLRAGGKEASADATVKQAPAEAPVDTAAPAASANGSGGGAHGKKARRSRAY